MNNPHLSATAEIAAQLRQRADQSEPHFSTTRIIAAAFPNVVVAGHDGDPAIIGMLMRACGHVILYQRELSIEEHRVRIAHALAHLIMDDRHRDAACTHRPDEEAFARRFEGDLLVPLDELAPLVYRWPPVEAREARIYRDQCDLLASQFKVPPSLIDKRIRELRDPAFAGFTTRQNL